MARGMIDLLSSVPSIFFFGVAILLLMAQLSRMKIDMRPGVYPQLRFSNAGFTPAYAFIISRDSGSITKITKKLLELSTFLIRKYSRWVVIPTISRKKIGACLFP